MRRLLALLVLAVTVTACGDDDDAATPDVDDTIEAPSDGDAEDAADDPPRSDTFDEGGADPLVFVAELSGAAEVPGPGDPAGSGRIEIESAGPTVLCVDMVAQGLDAEVTGAHLHEGGADASGGVVVDLGLPTSVEADVDTWTNVCIDLEAALVEQMASTPEAFYANVHTATFGDGAVRGQLTTGSIFDLSLT